MATQPTRTDDCVASSSCLPVVVGKRVATSWLACKETYRLAVEAYRRTVLILLADGENAGTFIDSLWNKFVARAPVFVGWASCFVCPSSEVRAASWRSLPPWKTFSPFSLRPRNKKKKSERGGFSSCGRSADAVYLLWVIRAGYLSETIGRSTALLSPTRFTFFFFLNSRIVNFCSNGGQIETGFHLFTFLTGISRCCELVQQPSKIYAF